MAGGGGCLPLETRIYDNASVEVDTQYAAIVQDDRIEILFSLFLQCLL